MTILKKIKWPALHQPAPGFVRVLLAGVLVLTFATGHAQSRSFVEKFRPLADSLSAVYGIPTAVILGVSIIESASGTSRNCKLLNNYFGIVGKNNLMHTRKIRTRYKQYPDATASFTHFCQVQSRKKYYKKLKGNMNYKIWLDHMSRNGYSEVPAVWKQRVTAAIIQNKLSVSR